MFKKITLLGVTGVLALTLSVGVANALPATNASTSNSDKVTVEKAGDMDKGARHGDCGAEFATILGMDADTLNQELKSGKTLAQIAATKGIDENTLTQKLQAQFIAKIDKAVADGKMTSEKATEIKAKSAEKIANMINKPWTGQKGDKGRANVFKNVKAQLPALLGLTDVQIKEQLTSGKTLAGIAQEKGIAKDVLISKIQSIMKADLDQAVKDQKITADKASELEAKLPEMIERMVTNTKPQK